MTPIYQKDGLTFFREQAAYQCGDSLIIEPDRLPQAIAYIQKHDIRAISINPNYGTVASLNFLKNIPAITDVSILQAGLDLTPIYQLRSLRRLNTDATAKPLDISRLPDLEILGISYTPKVKNLHTATKIRWLWLSGVKDTDLSVLAGMKQLHTLNLNNVQIHHLHGLEALTELEFLSIDKAPALTTLSGIGAGHTALQSFGLYNAKSMSDYTALRQLTGLKRLIIGRCANHKSIDFLSELPQLEQVSIG